MAKRSWEESSSGGDNEPSSSPPQSSEDERPAKKKEKTIEQRYQKKSQLEHILLRPDTYVGSLDLESASTWVWDDTQERMIYRQIKFVPAMFKIFDEILVNAADVKAREQHETKRTGGLQKMTRIEVDIDEQNACISVFNDGSGIPVEIHKEHQVYVPELIFGHLLTSDNYDDDDARVTGGRNGFGAKLTNIFSSKFSVEVMDSVRKRKFTMTWTGNMGSHTPPKVSDCSTKTDHVKITFWPDLPRFKTSGLEPDLVALMKKRVYDIAGTTGVRVSLNGQKLGIRDFKTYVDLYFAKPAVDDPNFMGDGKIVDVSEENEGPSSSMLDGEDGDDSDESFSGVGKKKKKGGKKAKSEMASSSVVAEANGIVKIHEKVNARWEVVVSQSDGQFQQVSFVNSICTTKGGTHVNYVVEPLIAALLKKVQSKNKGGIEIKGHNVRNHLFVFVNCLIVNPTFDSQTKETLTLRPTAFGSTCQLSDKTINAVVKSPILESVLLWAQTKQQVDLKRMMKSGAGGSRRDRILGVPKLDDANDAGTRHAMACTLILTEGDSAKTSCVAGLSVVGRDRYGIFPLRGKVLNVRDASFKSLTENKEIQNILKITGLDIGRKIQDPRTLRYGCIMIMTDQDHDGSHIKGLLINLLQHYWPDLLKCRGFLKEFITPIVKVSKGSTTHSFFTLPEYENWKELNNKGKGWKLKYYKGLGTSDDREFKTYFSDLDRHLLEFRYEGPEDFEAIDMAFNTKRSEDRKHWIQSFEEGTFLDHREKVVTYRDFINKELVLFSKYDLERSIPSVMDGWKPGQRKVLFGVFKRDLVRSEMKVAQLASYVAEHSSYHHGEESLAATIVNMAQTFVGSNNLNVLHPCGQFGSRKEGGKDASATRYIYTKLSITARALFNKLDEDLLIYNNEEGRVIEPKWYIPVIPLVLVNGADGIGTGWSSSVPNFNPRDIIKNLRAFIKGEPMEPMQPWYRGFTGRIEKSAKTKGYESVGIIEKLDDETLHIIELPVRQWTQPYKEFLEELMQAGIDEEQAAAGRAVRPKAKAKSASGKSAAGKRAAGRGAGAETGAARAARSGGLTIIDFRDNCSHESIDFTIKMSPTVLAAAEAEGLEKVFRLRKPIAMTNMTLFNAKGMVVRYESELDILRDFAKIRLDYYHRRKRQMLNLLEKDKTILSNKLKFVLMVIEGQLVVQKKKKKELVEELSRIGFDRMSVMLTRFNTQNPTMEGDLEEDGIIREASEVEEKAEDVVGKDFEYLLGMPLWSLTYEKVETLRQQKQEKEQEYDDFKRRVPEDLWEADLVNLEQAITAHEDDLAKQTNEDKVLRRRASFGNSKRVIASRAKAKAKGKAAAKTVKSEPSDFDTNTSTIPSNTSSMPSNKPRTKLAPPLSPKQEPSSPARDFGVMQRLREKFANAENKIDTLDSLFGKVENNAAEVPTRKRSPQQPSEVAAAPAKRIKQKTLWDSSDSSDSNPTISGLQQATLSTAALKPSVATAVSKPSVATAVSKPSVATAVSKPSVSTAVSKPSVSKPAKVVELDDDDDEEIEDESDDEEVEDDDEEDDEDEDEDDSDE